MNPLEEYAKICRDIKTLEARKEQLKAVVLDEIDDCPYPELETQWGKFVKRSRTTYIYSQELQKKEYELKELKRREEVSGVAEIKSSVAFPVLYGMD